MDHINELRGVRDKAPSMLTLRAVIIAISNIFPPFWFGNNCFALLDSYESFQGKYWNWYSPEYGQRWSFNSSNMNPCADRWRGIGCSCLPSEINYGTHYPRITMTTAWILQLRISIAPFRLFTSLQWTLISWRYSQAAAAVSRGAWPLFEDHLLSTPQHLSVSYTSLQVHYPVIFHLLLQNLTLLGISNTLMWFGGENKSPKHYLLCKNWIICT